VGHPADRDRPLERPLGTQVADRGWHVGAGGWHLRHRDREELRVVALGQRAPWGGHGDGLPGAHCRRLGQLPSLLAGTLPERLPLLAGPRLRGRCALCRDHRGHPGYLLGNRVRWGVDVLLWGGRGSRHA
jgi:hypothetical protein